MTSSLRYSPFLPEVMKDPFPFYRRLRDEAPVYRLEGHDAWALSRFEDVWRATEDAETFVSAGGTTAAQVVSRVESPVPSINQLDGDEHTRLRKAIRGVFGRASAHALEPLVRREARRRIEAARAQGELDVVGGLADPVAAIVACRLLSLPDEAGPLLVEWVHRYARNTPGDEGRSPDALAAAMEMNAYLAELVARRRRGRGEPGVVDVFLEHQIDGRKLADLEIASHMMTLVIGGTDTTPKVISSALLRLHRAPEQRADLAAHPDAIPGAFVEALRLDMPTQFMARTVARETTIHGEKLRPGEGVLFLFASANRDEREYADPERFDARRKSRRHLGFGHAAHVCIGAHVAALEGRVVLEEILAADPDYQIDERRIGWRSADQLRGMSSLPLRFSGT